ncbi:type VI secretion system baseplate subunit TssG [Viridibacterium curvum]|uniref:Type VI secretion system baseplate subunit TssG n=1 Tax=Viridibacterium curvum TaxID=1101404 RepID=A0ABP9R7P3_9RHOO
MPTAQRRPDPGVIERLRAEPYRFEFFQAVRVLVTHFRRNGATGNEDPVGEHIRFGNSLNIGFAPSEIEALQFEYDEASTQDVAWPESAPQPPSDAITRAHLTPAFIGMTGSQGTLPHTYTEQLVEREIRHRDRGARAFLDVFTNRSVALFYRAWEKYRLYFQYERNRQERFLPMVLSLVGAGNPSVQDKVCDTARPVLAETLAYYAGALRHSARPAHLIERIIADYFQVPVKLVQFQGRWHTLPDEQLSMLGGSMRLGVDTVCGNRMWHVQTAFELNVGPLKREDFERFLPGGEAAEAITRLLAMLSGITLECTVRPILRKEDVRPIRLDSQAGTARLGHNTWVLTRMTHEHRSDVAYDITHEEEQALAA